MSALIVPFIVYYFGCPCRSAGLCIWQKLPGAGVLLEGRQTEPVQSPALPLPGPPLRKDGGVGEGEEMLPKVLQTGPQFGGGGSSSQRCVPNPGNKPPKKKRTAVNGKLFLPGLH